MRFIFISVLFSFLATTMMGQTDERPDYDTAMRYYVEGVEALSLGDSTLAISLFQQAIKNPAIPFPFAILSLISFEKNDFELAIQYAEEGLYRIVPYLKDPKLQPWNIDLMRLLAESYSYFGNYRGVVKTTTKLILMKHEEPLVYALRADAFLKSLDIEEAYSDILKAEALAPDDAKVLAIKGEILFFGKDYTQAANNLEKAKTLGYTHSEYDYYMGVSKANSTEPILQEIIFHLEKYIEDNQGNEVPSETLKNLGYYLGSAYFDARDSEKSVNYLAPFFENFHRGSPYLCGVYVKGLVINGQLEKAEPLIKLYLKDFPEEGFFDATLGELYTLKGDTNQAKKYFESAMLKGTIDFVKADLLSDVAAGFALIDDYNGRVAATEALVKLYPRNVSLQVDLLYLYLLNVEKNANNVLQSLDLLIDLHTDKPDVKAYFMAEKAVISYFFAEDQKGSLLLLDKAIELDDFAEYKIWRGYITLMRELEGAKPSFTLNNKKQLKAIMKDLSAGSNAGLRLDEVYFLKALTLMSYNMVDESCDAMDQARKVNPNIEEETGIYFCQERKKQLDAPAQTYIFQLSSYFERFN